MYSELSSYISRISLTCIHKTRFLWVKQNDWILVGRGKTIETMIIQLFGST